MTPKTEPDRIYRVRSINFDERITVKSTGEIISRPHFLRKWKWMQDLVDYAKKQRWTVTFWAEAKTEAPPAEVNQ